MQTRTTRTDVIIAVILAAVMFVLGLGFLSDGLQDWGDDHSAYLNQAIAIAEGRQAEQARLNAFMHPSLLPDEAQTGSLTYVWGYPLLLAVVYRLVGFDRVGYTSIFWYKLPSLIALSLLAPVLYLFYRRRYSRRLSLGLALFFYQSGAFFRTVNRCYSDLVFMFAAMLTLLLAEIWREKLEGGRGTLAGIVLAVSMWFTHEVRLNGLAVCTMLLVAHIALIARGRLKPSRRTAWQHALPYVLAVALALVTERLWLGTATSNLSDLKRFDGLISLRNLSWYLQDAVLMFDGSGGTPHFVVGLAVLLLMLMGMARRSREGERHLKALTVISYFVAVALPYYQGARYLYNVLPLVLMYAADGLLWCVPYLASALKPAAAKRLPKVLRGLLLAMLAGFYTALAVQSVTGALDRDSLKPWYDVYTDESIGIFNYIQDNTPQDAVIAFRKPRALYLNTRRVSFCPGSNGHTLDEADYFLYDKFRYGSGDSSTMEPQERLELVYENAQFAFYRVVG